METTKRLVSEFTDSQGQSGKPKRLTEQPERKIVDMEFKLVPVKKKQPLKAMKKCIAIVAVSLVVIAATDELLLDHAITKNLDLFRERQQKKYAERTQKLADELEWKIERARKQNQTTARSYVGD